MRIANNIHDLHLITIFARAMIMHSLLALIFMHKNTRSTLAYSTYLLILTLCLLEIQLNRESESPKGTFFRLAVA